MVKGSKKRSFKKIIISPALKKLNYTLSELYLSTLIVCVETTAERPISIPANNFLTHPSASSEFSILLLPEARYKTMRHTPS